MSSLSTLPALIPTVLSASKDPQPAAEPAAPLFTRERQAVFLAALAATGAVRSAAGRAGISHQTAYRERLASPGFRRAWDAALVAARARGEEVLASRALDGWAEDVVYHGEVVCTRRRFSDRLLLAHLARLDKLCAEAEVAAFADDFDAALARYAAGEDRPARPFDGLRASGSGDGAEEGDFSSPGQWSRRSTDAEEQEDIPPPLPPVKDRHGATDEAQQLEVGLYHVWWDEEREHDLTTWPAPDDFAGEELAVDADSDEVLGAWPLDPEVPGAERCYWARTLTPAEEAGRAAADERQAEHRFARRELYRRAVFGLASPAELASLAAANPGNPEWAGRVHALAFAQ